MRTKTRTPFLSAMVMTIAAVVSTCGDDPTDVIARPGTSTGNGLVVGAHSSQAPADPTPAGSDAQGTELALSTSQAYVRHIGLHLPDGTTCADVGETLATGVICDAGAAGDGDELRIEGPFVFDLIAKTSNPALTDVALPALTYRRVDVRFEPGRPQDGLINATHPLNGYALVANGGLSYQSVPRTFDFGLSFSEETRFASASGVTLSADAPITVLMLLDVVQWFSTLPITQCLDDRDLVFVGDHVTIRDAGGGGCGTIENDLKAAIEASGDLRQR